MRQLDPLEIQAISNVMAELDNTPITAAEFLNDIPTMKHRKWHIFKIELGKVKSIHFKGRAVPARRSKPTYEQQFKFGTAYVREKTQPGYFKTIDLKGLFPKQKLLKVLNSDMQLSIKEEYIKDIIARKI